MAGAAQIPSSVAKAMPAGQGKKQKYCFVAITNPTQSKTTWQQLLRFLPVAKSAACLAYSSSFSLFTLEGCNILQYFLVILLNTAIIIYKCGQKHALILENICPAIFTEYFLILNEIQYFFIMRRIHILNRGGNIATVDKKVNL
jgi:hypothetical protein